MRQQWLKGTSYPDARELPARQSWGVQHRGTPGIVLGGASWECLLGNPLSRRPRPGHRISLSSKRCRLNGMLIASSIIAHTALGELPVTAAVPPSSSSARSQSKENY